MASSYSAEARLAAAASPSSSVTWQESRDTVDICHTPGQQQQQQQQGRGLSRISVVVAVVAVVAVAPCVLVEVGGPAPELHVQLGNSLSQPHILSRVTCYSSCVMLHVFRGHDAMHGTMHLPATN